MMAGSKKQPTTKKPKRPMSDEQARHRARLLRWAELIDRVEDLSDAIDAAWQDDVISEDVKDEAVDGLQLLYDILRPAAWARRAL
jgi:hypothetical protein